MLEITSTGTGQIKDLSKILAALRRIEFTLIRNSEGEIDMESSFREMERAIDRKLQQFSDNLLAKQVGNAAKQQFREHLLNQAAESRSGLGLPRIPISGFDF